ncbi:MAG: hypothetical protein QG622_1321 [Actinomycetota bacterium]|nr:hypothetical protein [Actinomycetota bacterium]
MLPGVLRSRRAVVHSRSRAATIKTGGGRCPASRAVTGHRRVQSLSRSRRYLHTLSAHGQTNGSPTRSRGRTGCTREVIETRDDRYDPGSCDPPPLPPMPSHPAPPRPGGNYAHYPSRQRSHTLGASGRGDGSDSRRAGQARRSRRTIGSGDVPIGAIRPLHPVLAPSGCHTTPGSVKTSQSRRLCGPHRPPPDPGKSPAVPVRRRRTGTGDGHLQVVPLSGSLPLTRYSSTAELMQRDSP